MPSASVVAVGSVLVGWNGMRAIRDRLYYIFRLLFWNSFCQIILLHRPPPTFGEMIVEINVFLASGRTTVGFPLAAIGIDNLRTIAKESKLDQFVRHGMYLSLACIVFSLSYLVFLALQVSQKITVKGYHKDTPCCANQRFAFMFFTLLGLFGWVVFLIVMVVWQYAGIVEWMGWTAFITIFFLSICCPVVLAVSDEDWSAPAPPSPSPLPSAMDTPPGVASTPS